MVVTIDCIRKLNQVRVMSSVEYDLLLVLTQLGKIDRLLFHNVDIDILDPDTISKQ